MKKLSMAIAIAATAISGCVSVQGTRTQLSSKDAAEVKKAEETIYTIATTGKDPSGFNQFETWQQIQYVDLASNNDLLLRIFDNASDANVIVAAVGRMDFSKDGEAYSFAKKRFGRFSSFGRGAHEMEVKIREMKKQIISKMTEKELIDLLDNATSGSNDPGVNMGTRSRGGSRTPGVSQGFQDQDMVKERLAEITGSPDVLIRYGGWKEQWKRLLSMLDKITDAQTIEKLLTGEGEPNLYRVENSKDRLLLLKKLPKEKMVEFTLKDIEKTFSGYRNKYSEKYNRRFCDDRDFSALEVGVSVSACVNDEKSAIKILKSIVFNLYYCDIEGRGKLLAGFPHLSDSAIIELACCDDWDYLMDKVTADIAYEILTQGRAACDKHEIALVKRLPPERVDLKILAGVKTDAGKKAVMAAMPANVRKAAQEITEKAFAAVMAKAKEASKETFEMQGFYLGMDWEDMKVVLAHHFPDYEITEKRDGNESDSAHVVYISKQKTPFCFASAKDKKVYRFNFGKQVLKMWYKYDVQGYREWARMYSRENKIDMKYKMIDEEVDIPERDLSQFYKVWFHQESYQYKHNAKEYRLTYFGEEKDFTAHGGIGGAVIKAMAAQALRDIRDDPGTLRAAIEKD